jgi:putative phosphoribosyl transferase
MFENRQEAGKKLGQALEKYKGTDGIVLAIPKGGVEVGYYVAEHLQLQFCLVVVRKLPFPDNPEAGFGAIAEDGSIYLIDRFCAGLSCDLVQSVIEEQRLELQRRIEVLRHGEPLPKLKGKIVILIDDGIAMGSTIQAAVMLCRNQKTKKIVVAAPVAGPTVATELAQQVDETVILEQPVSFRAVAEVYRTWYDVGDEEVTQIMERTHDFQHASQRNNQGYK